MQLIYISWVKRKEEKKPALTEQHHGACFMTNSRLHQIAVPQPANLVIGNNLKYMVIDKHLTAEKLGPTTIQQVRTDDFLH